MSFLYSPPVVIIHLLFSNYATFRVLCVYFDSTERECFDRKFSTDIKRGGREKRSNGGIPFQCLNADDETE